jgi:formate dehydrogenase iron-sulfur subunit
MALQHIFPPAPTQNIKVDLSEADLVRRSASSVPQPARKLTSVAKLIDTSKCIGCKACESACLEWNNLREEVGFNHGVYDNPLDLTPESLTVMRFSEWINPETQNLEWLIRKDGCMHCEDPGCLKACPAPGAIVQYSNGIVDFDHDKCIGCGYCIKGCPFNIPRISKVDNKAYKCTLCSDRVAVGQGPACAKACPTQAIVFGTKDEMKAHAEARIKDLKSRGYKNAGLYDPPGVGGTHVMYVLHHADKPEIYSNLAKDPKISPIVEVWKGVSKYVGMATIGAFAAVGFLHHMISGANRVSPEDEENAQRLTGGKK